MYCTIASERDGIRNPVALLADAYYIPVAVTLDTKLARVVGLAAEVIQDRAAGCRRPLTAAISFILPDGYGKAGRCLCRYSAQGGWENASLASLLAGSRNECIESSEKYRQNSCAISSRWISNAALLCCSSRNSR